MTNEIVYCIYDNGVYRLKSVDLNGESRLLNLAYLNPIGTFPSISPYGRLLSYEQWTLRKNIYRAVTCRFVPEDARIELLESDAAARMHSCDGRRVYFSSTRSGDWRVWKVPASGGTAVQVTRTNGFAAMESVDVQTLFYCKRGIPGIREKTGEAEEDRVVADLEIFETQNRIVVVDGIYYLKRLKNRYAQMMFYRFADKSLTPLSHALLSD